MDVYAALAWKPNDRFRLDANFEYFDVPHYPDNAGINRPTQALINNDTYIQGTGVSPVTGIDPRTRRGRLADRHNDGFRTAKCSSIPRITATPTATSARSPARTRSTTISPS